MRPILHVTEDLAALAGPLLQRAIEESVARGGRCRLALSGGSTPGATFDWLAEHLPAALYPHLWITWIDERHTPDAGQRNDHLARRWLDGVRPAAVVPMAYQPDPERACAAFRADFEARLGGLDVVLLGVGPDGHVASIFPGHPAMRASAPCVVVRGSPKPPPVRITLTLPTLAGAAHAILIARGADKAAALAGAWRGEPHLPLAHLGPAGISHWILDPTAAARIRAEDRA